LTARITVSVSLRLAITITARAECGHGFERQRGEVGSPANQVFNAAHAACGLPPPQAELHSNSPMFTRSMLSGSELLAVAPSRHAFQDESTGLYRRVTVLVPGSERPMGVTTREIGRPSPDLLAVLDTMRAVASQLSTNA
jgi:LysR family transcriptional regulator, regulator for genes of the gallate degradation pathway